MSVESLQKLDLRQIQIIKNLSDTVEIEKNIIKPVLVLVGNSYNFALDLQCKSKILKNNERRLK